MPLTKTERGKLNSLTFEEIKKAVANIAQLNYFNPSKETRVKCDASHSGVGATQKKTGKGSGCKFDLHRGTQKLKKKNVQQMSKNCSQ